MYTLSYLRELCGIGVRQNSLDLNHVQRGGANGLLVVLDTPAGSERRPGFIIGCRRYVGCKRL